MIALPLLLSVSQQQQISTQHASGNTMIKSIFVILMENHNWSQIKGNKSAPYINNTLLSMSSHAEQYFNPPGLHPSEPNYIWLEAGTNFGITNDNDPTANHIHSTNHLVTQLNNTGLTWKAYVENISGNNCPLVSSGLFGVKHTGMLFFDDVTHTNNAQSSYCIQHVRPYSELATDLNGRVANYNFITPNLCDDMHNNSGCTTNDAVKNGDTWLANNIPQIMNSQAYKNGGAIFITWDESEGGDFPIGMIVLSPFAKKGYSNTIHYTHSSMLKTAQEIFGLSPFLADASMATDLSDFFTIPLIDNNPASSSSSPSPSAGTGTPTPTTATSLTPLPSSTCSSQIPHGHTSIDTAIFLHGLGKAGDNANPNGGGNTSPLHTQRTATITVFDSNNQQKAQGQGCIAYNTADGFFNGAIDIGTLTSGSYLVKVTVPGYLQQQISGIKQITSGQPYGLQPISRLTTGDINMDNQLDILDYNLLIGCFGSKQHTSSCTASPDQLSPGADLTDDGTVDGADYNLFLRELSVQHGGGEISPTPTPTSIPNATTTPTLTPSPSSSKSILGVNNSSAFKTYLPTFQSAGISSVRVFALYQPNLKGYLATLASAHIRPLLVLDEATMVNGSLQYCHASKGQEVNSDQQIVQALLDTYGSGYDGWFEFGNEPNTSPGNCGYTATQYAAGWNAVIPQLKAMAPNAKFGGPVLPNTDTSYISTFLQQANPKPDFVSWHLYAGSYKWNTNQLQSAWQGWSNQIGSVNNTVKTILGNSIPLLITEWNYAWDGGVGPDPRVTPLSTSTFAQNFAQQVLTEFQTAGVTASYLFVDPGFPSPVETTISDPSFGQLTLMGRAFSAYK